jgi:opacity protein-like surface antigen
MRIRLAIAILVLLVCSVGAHAQSNEIAAEASGMLLTSPYNPGAGVGFQLNYAHRLFHVPLVSVYGEIPFVAGFNNTQFVVTQLARENFNSYYVTPGLRVKFAPGFIVSPWVAAGVGWAHFSSTQNNSSDTNFAADWGGGLDFKVFPFVSLRLEARDFYSGVPALSLGLPLPLPGNQNNIVVSGGVVARF